MPAPFSIAAARQWLLTCALPLWLRHGVDHRAGAFHEALSPYGYTCDAPFRRLRVAARQITVFSRAHAQGLAGAAEATELGLDFLKRHAALPEGGYAWRFDLNNRPIDTTRDLYDHGFVLLALAEAATFLPVAPLRAEALTLVAFLDRHMRHADRGWVESLPPRLPRRQNPHMHLLEAMLAAHHRFGDKVFLDRAAELVGLFLAKLADRTTGALPEYFDDALRPLLVRGVFTTEPGHLHEWAWLLHESAGHGIVLPGSRSAIDRLLGFADAHGIHPSTGDLIDAVGSDGSDPVLSTRLWPQTERLRTALVLPNRSDLQQTLASLSAYLRPDGLWRERRAPDGRFLPGPSPASSLYHLTTAIRSVRSSSPD